MVTENNNNKKPFVVMRGIEMEEEWLWSKMKLDTKCFFKTFGKVLLIKGRKYQSGYRIEKRKRK